SRAARGRSAGRRWRPGRIGRSAAPGHGRQDRQELLDLARFQIVLDRLRRAGGAVGVLRRVGVLDDAVVERDVLDRYVARAARDGEIRDDDVLHLDLQVRNRFVTGAART